MMIAKNTNLRAQLVMQFNDFATTARARTSDVVASIPVLLAQIFSFNSLSPEEQKTPQEEGEEE